MHSTFATQVAAYNNNGYGHPYPFLDAETIIKARELDNRVKFLHDHFGIDTWIHRDLPEGMEVDEEYNEHQLRLILSARIRIELILDGKRSLKTRMVRQISFSKTSNV